MTILVVDDSRVMRQIVARTLRQAGLGSHPVVEAGDGRSALAAALEHSPALVIADWGLPEMSGVELLQALRASGQTMPFCLLTAEGSPSVVAQAQAAGAAAVVPKPFTVEALRGALQPVLGC